jgi:hypothetical protein
MGSVGDVGRPTMIVYFGSWRLPLVDSHPWMYLCFGVNSESYA